MQQPQQNAVEYQIPPIEEPVVKKKVNEKDISFLREKYNENKPVGTRLDIRPLWDNVYRINFWVQKVKGGDELVIDSVFLRIDNTEEGLVVHEYKDKKTGFKFTDM